MMNKKLILLLSIVCSQSIHAYHQPAIALGQNNILDGGPLRPLPGWYLRSYFNYYYASSFRDNKGELLGGVPSPHLNAVAFALQLLYQFKRVFLGASPGIALGVPFVLHSKVDDNLLGITSNGSGVGDLVGGVYLQWPVIALSKKKPVGFVHRIACDFVFPTGKYCADKSINPSSHVFVISPHWAATFFFNTHLAASWRLTFVHSTENKTNHYQGGNLLHVNFDLEWRLAERFWLGFVGYYLHQVSDTKLSCVKVPDSRERVLGTGVGALYMVPHKWYFLTYLFGESFARNRQQGIRFVMRFIKHL